MEWLEVTVPAGGADINALGELLEALDVGGLVTEDEADFNDFLENGARRWGYVDEKLLEERRGLNRVKFYLEKEGADGKLSDIRARLGEFYASQGLPPPELGLGGVRDGDWADAWKQYYKPIPVGKGLLIVPEWESCAAEGRTVLRLDPGLAFGTGSHPTTQLCLEALETIGPEGMDVMDLGCGSGILSAAALLLGAERVFACDIDPKALDASRHNAALNGVGERRLTLRAGDILADAALIAEASARKADLALANIVADVILALCPALPRLLKRGGLFVCSGVIEGRQDEVRAALVRCGLAPLSESSRGGWHAFTARLGPGS